MAALVRIFACIILTSLLVLPAVGLVLGWAPGAPLYGYVPGSDEEPAPFAHAVLNRTFQDWADTWVRENLGFRAALTRSFNELTFQLFKRVPTVDITYDHHFGLYANEQISALRTFIDNKQSYEKQFTVFAKQLRQVQDIITARGAAFVVVIASSKAFVYPQGIVPKYIYVARVAPEAIYDKAASLGNALASAGVNVVDTGPRLRAVARAGIPTHAVSGWHWNYYAGCLAARWIVDSARGNAGLPGIDCGAPQLATPSGVDRDALLILNLWSAGGLTAPTARPSVARAPVSTPRLRIIFIGDSYGSQIVTALVQAGLVSRLSFDSYYRTVEVFEGDNLAPSSDTGVLPPSEAAAAIDSEIAHGDLVVLEMVDYNIGRWGYGLVEHMLGTK